MRKLKMWMYIGLLNFWGYVWGLSDYILGELYENYLMLEEVSE